SAQTAPQASQQASSGAPGQALTTEQARTMANLILQAVKSGDANARYSQFSDELKAVTSPTMVQRTMKAQPKLLSWKILGITQGVQNTTVEAALTTAKGPRDLFIVLNGNGKIIGYHFDRTDVAASKVASSFVTTLAGGQYISARSFLSLGLQKEISPAALQQKWQELQQLTGNFVRVKKAVEANSTPNARLVLVVTEFNRLTDNLFVILDNHNQIVGVDFPIDPNKPQPVN
ncbi:MAG: DUF3887 domain-containing protein, partial [Synechococcaceae bacterium WB9_2_170]|nr:DUF3887 domain-containing protein [Synechococcaceae bacterium WB9_2_170]